jgi:hypothetical protein
MGRNLALPKPDFNAQRRPGPHVLILDGSNQDAPGVYEIRCSCGEVTWTPWGEEHAVEIAEIHRVIMGVGPSKRTFVL